MASLKQQPTMSTMPPPSAASPLSSHYATPAHSGALLTAAAAGTSGSVSTSAHGFTLCADGQHMDVSIAENAQKSIFKNAELAPTSPRRGAGMRDAARRVADKAPFRKHKRKHSSALVCAVLRVCAVACLAVTAGFCGTSALYHCHCCMPERLAPLNSA